VLSGSVDATADDEHPGLMLVRMQVGDSRMVARLTKRAAVALEVAVGQTLWVQVKSVALMK
jgi:molybdate transport system ATP-binding protein